MSPRKVNRTTTPPPGLLYVPDFLSIDEEGDLLALLDGMTFNDFVLQGQAARRKVRHFGFGYEFYSKEVHVREDFPEWLIGLRDRAAQAAGIDSQLVEQSLVNKYSPGAGIGWHRDAPAFGPTVMGLSLGSDDVIRFRREVDGQFEMYKQPLARRSLYVMTGAARSLWQHSITPVKELRYSITFRTIREQFRGERAQRDVPTILDVR